MFHTEDAEEDEIYHDLTLDSIEIERKLCQTRLLHLYNDGKITEDEFAARLRKLTLLTKDLYNLICDLYNLTELV
jgi:hypothetical protein